MDWKTLYKIIKMINWLTLFVLSSVSFFVMSPRFTTGVILGGLIIIANFNVLQHTICGAFSPGESTGSAKVGIIAKYYVRFLALGVIIYLLIADGRVDPVGLAVGLSTVVFSITLLGIHMAMKTKAGEAI
ncbi:MAG: ATP synthase subunit I [Desulfobacterales bacterium]|nr:ATP synthase subunit I [Desulfobacterales bacterium]